MDEQNQKPDTAVGRLRAVTADLMRPVSYDPRVVQNTPTRKPEEKANYPRALWSGKFLLLSLAVLGAFIGIVRVVRQVPMYRADTTIELTAPNTAFLGKGAVDPGASETIVSGANVQTQLRIMVGPGLLRRTIERVSLESAPIAPPSSSLVSRIRNRYKLVPQDNMDFLRGAVNSAASSVAAKQIGTTHLIQLSCESMSAEMAAVFINSLAAEYIAQSQQARSSSVTRMMQWLATQMEDSRGKMEEADQRLQEFVKTQGLPFVLDQNTLAVSKLRDLQMALAASQTDRIAKQARFDLAKSSPIDSLSDVLEDIGLKNLQVTLTGLLKDRSVLTATLTPEHVKVRRVDAEIAEVENALKLAKENLVRRIQNDYEGALQNERMTTNAYNAAARAVANQSDGAAKYMAIKREAETARQTFNQLSDQYASMELMSAVPTSLGRVIDAAVPIHTPYKPQPARDISIATAIGLVLAAAFLALKETIRIKKLSRVFASPGDSGQVLNVPELGIIPTFQLDGSVRRHMPFSFRTLRIGSRPDEVAVPDLTSWSKQPFLAESIRHAVTSILVHGNGELHQLLVITSASPEEGKTTLIGNLGVTMAEAGRRVLMVDADLRAPRLHNLFRMDRKNGLTEIYQDKTPVDELALEDYIKDTNIPNLSLLASGEMQLPRLGEMLFSRRIRELFSRLRREYDFVLVDTAPTLQFSDARLLGQISDGVILIIRSGVSSRDNVQLTAQRIAEDGIPIVGTILNDWQPNQNGSSHDDYFLGAYDHQDGLSSKVS